MELTYMVRGGDGKEYGPVSLNQLTRWIAEGRLTANQEVKRSDMEHWAAAGSFTELQTVFNPANPAVATATPGPMAGPRAAGQTDPHWAVHMKSGASWFYWIAGLSLINAFSRFFGAGFRFFFGLGAIDLIDGSVRPAILALALDLLAAGVCALFGVFSGKGQSWAFIVGMLLFALDGLIFVLEQDWLAAGLHALALFFIFRGFLACLKLRKAARV
jgi:hypothetical protein